MDKTLKTDAQSSVLRQLSDEREITAILYKYAFALDQKDWKALEDCFLENATAEYDMVGALSNYNEIEALCRRALTPMTQTQHLIGNVSISVVDDHASSVCYLQAQHVRSGYPGGDKNIIAGQYLDKFIRTKHGWKIQHRILKIQWTFGNADIHDLGGDG
ncbi:nuclear transport factor 2 family protein [Hyphococcus sp.]|uniref:nuclear transport factor 2 family protein n=1 Tax=Hyphococcus sp. TaxID=2038636 RepID=UPI003CCBF25E